VPLEHDGARAELGEARVGQDRPLAPLDVHLHELGAVVLGEQIDDGHRHRMPALDLGRFSRTLRGPLDACQLRLRVEP
jgi:hypothetical protein